MNDIFIIIKQNDMKRITLTENNTVVELSNEELNQYNNVDIDKLNLKDIRTKAELISFIKIKQNELKSISIAMPYLSEQNIRLKRITNERFAPYDAVGISGVTNMFGEIYDEDIIMEFKYRTGRTVDQCNSIIIDEKKRNELLEISKDNKHIRVFIVYVYKDNHIRLFELTKHFDNYIKKEKSIFQSAQYRLGENKESLLYYYDNNLTLRM